MERHLAGYGPASLADIGKWLGQPRVTKVRGAVEALGDRIVPLTGPDGRDLVDLADAPRIVGDTDPPVRFLARWDSVLIAYDLRDRILPQAYRDDVIKKNGDFLPTFLVDGLVAGLWTVDASRSEAVLTMTPFGKLTAAVAATWRPRRTAWSGSWSPRRPGTAWPGRRASDDTGDQPPVAYFQ